MANAPIEPSTGKPSTSLPLGTKHLAIGLAAPKLALAFGAMLLILVIIGGGENATPESSPWSDSWLELARGVGLAAAIPVLPAGQLIAAGSARMTSLFVFASLLLAFDIYVMVSYFRPYVERNDYFMMNADYVVLVFGFGLTAGQLLLVVSLLRQVHSVVLADSCRSSRERTSMAWRR